MKKTIALTISAIAWMTASNLTLAANPIPVASDTSSTQIEQLNKQIQGQLKQLQAEQQEQMMKLNSQLQAQISQIQAKLQQQMQLLNGQTQTQLKNMQQTLQQQIKEIQQQATQHKA